MRRPLHCRPDLTKRRGRSGRSAHYKLGRIGRKDGWQGKLLGEGFQLERDYPEKKERKGELETSDAHVGGRLRDLTEIYTGEVGNQGELDKKLKGVKKERGPGVSASFLCVWAYEKGGERSN